MDLTNHLHLVPRLKKELNIPPLPLWDFTSCYRVNFTFTFYLTRTVDEIMLNTSYKTVKLPWSRWLIAGPSLWIPGFDPKAVCGIYGRQCSLGTGFSMSFYKAPYSYFISLPQMLYA